MPGQDPLDQTYAKGPFSQYLDPSSTPQTYQSTAEKPSGFGGTAEFAGTGIDKFLSGFSRGRSLAYARSMQERTNTYAALSASAQQVQQSDLPPEFKSAQLAKLNDLRGHVFLKTIDDGSGSTKGKKGGGQSSGDDDHPGGHILNAIRSFANAMVGPGAQKANVDPKDIAATLHETTELLKQAPQMSAQYTATSDKAVSEAFQAAIKDGKSPILAQQDPRVVTALSKNAQAGGGQYTPGVQNLLKSLTEQTSYDLKTAQVGEAAARTDYLKAQTKYYERRGFTLMQDEAGKTYLSDGSKIIDQATGEEVTDPVKLHRIGADKAPPRPLKEVDKSGVIHYRDPSTLKEIGVAKDARGNPIKTDTALGRMFLSQENSNANFDTQHAIQVNEDYDRQKDQISGKKDLTPKRRQELLDQNEKDRQKSLDIVAGRSAYSGSARTAPPPKPKGGAKAGGKAAAGRMTDEQFTNTFKSLLTGQAPAASTTAPPPKSATQAQDPLGLR